MTSRKTMSSKILAKYKKEMAEEVFNLSVYWSNFTIDEINGGFFGSVNNDNSVNMDAPKGLVLNSRILWAFSALYQRTRRESDLQLATRAFDFLTDHFIDEYNGGQFGSDFLSSTPVRFPDHFDPLLHKPEGNRGINTGDAR